MSDIDDELLEKEFDFSKAIKNPYVKKLKKNEIDSLTDHQFNSFLRMIIMIIHGCNDVEEAESKISSLLL